MEISDEIVIPGEAEYTEEIDVGVESEENRVVEESGVQYEYEDKPEVFDYDPQETDSDTRIKNEPESEESSEPKQETEYE